MTDFRLMRGEGWVRCCICGELHEEPYPDLATDEDGNLTDVCRGECAREAGIIVPGDGHGPDVDPATGDEAETMEVPGA